MSIGFVLGLAVGLDTGTEVGRVAGVRGGFVHGSQIAVEHKLISKIRSNSRLTLAVFQTMMFSLSAGQKLG